MYRSTSTLQSIDKDLQRGSAPLGQSAALHSIPSVCHCRLGSAAAIFNLLISGPAENQNTCTLPLITLQLRNTAGAANLS